MIDFLDEIARYLISEGVAASGEIFVNKLPADPDNCVSIWGLVGPTTTQSRDIPGLQFPRFQVLIRNTDYNDASDKHQAVRSALHGLINVTLPVTADTDTDPYIRLMRCHTDQEGGPIGEDDQGRLEFSINFMAEYHHYDPS